MPRTAAEIAAHWCDLFIVVDNGLVTAAEYARVETVLDAQRKRYPGGLGCLVIIPQGSAPPPDDVREYLRQMLARIGIKALAYVVEGSGFKVATVRAVLVGLGIFQKKPYVTHVTTTIEDAVKWLDTKMPPNAQRKNPLVEVERVVSQVFRR
ncbi:MAG: hypothetical protein ABI321_24535 [Polyangia bacterium]